jgi:predicted metal-dependent phosphotriesterase family hydrolase
MKKGVAEGVWFTFYHDHFMNACKYDDKGNVTEKWQMDRLKAEDRRSKTQSSMLNGTRFS